jgi:hypothetical protein
VALSIATGRASSRIRCGTPARHPDPEGGGGRGEQPEFTDCAEQASGRFYPNGRDLWERPRSVSTATSRDLWGLPRSVSTATSRDLGERPRSAPTATSPDLWELPRSLPAATSEVSGTASVDSDSNEPRALGTASVSLYCKARDLWVTASGYFSRRSIPRHVTNGIPARCGRGRPRHVTKNPGSLSEELTEARCKRSGLLAVEADRGLLRGIRKLRLFSAPPSPLWVGMPGSARRNESATMPDRSRCSEPGRLRHASDADARGSSPARGSPRATCGPSCGARRRARGVPLR